VLFFFFSHPILFVQCTTVQGNEPASVAAQMVEARLATMEMISLMPSMTL
jgi:hypothetical protein